MSAIFISHSSRDNEFCIKLMAWLDELGHRSVFLDMDSSSGIAAGYNWEQKLYQELRVCRAVIVVCTENLMNSKWCFAEITQARSLGKHIFPIKVSECKIDSVLSDSQIVDFLKLDEKEAFECLKNGLVIAGIDAEDPYNWDGSRSPYPGLLSFQEADAAIFFGRDKEIGDGLDVLNGIFRYGGSGLVMTLGASGSGKSSLIRAGIVPRLKRDPARWLVLRPMIPGNDPFRELVKVLKSAYKEYANQTFSGQQLYDQLLSPDLHHIEPVSQEKKPGEQGQEMAANNEKVSFPVNTSWLFNCLEDLKESASRPNASILLIIDQFEELLNRPKEHKCCQFLKLLRTLLEKEEDKITCLGTMRSDFLGAFQKNPALIGLEFGKLLIGPVDTPSLTEIIEKPAELAGVRIEPKLVQALIEEAGTDDALPLLAFTLRELYDKYADDNLLEYREYQDLLGGIQGAIAKAAEDILSKPRLTIEQDEHLRKSFLLMTRVNEDGQFVRNVAKKSDVPEEIIPVLDRLVDGRLLVSRGEEEGGETIEVAHEAIFRSWSRLRRWLDEDREFLLWRRRLNRAKDEWKYNNRDKSVLLTGGLLYEASNWFKRYKNQLDREERDYILKSVKAASKRKRRQVFLISGIITVITALGALMAVGFINANKEFNRAQANYLNSEANRLVKIDPTGALRLSGEAIKIQPQDDGIIKDSHTIYSENSFYKSILKHKATVNSAVFSSDGKTVLTGSNDNTARLWDLEGNPLGKVMRHEGSVFSAVFSSDGKTVLTGSDDNTARLWDLEGNPLGRVMQHKATVNSAVFSSDGQTVLTGSDDNTARLWDLEGNPVGKVMRHGGSVSSAVFSSDGKTVLTRSSDDKTARLWEIVTLEDFLKSGHIAPFTDEQKDKYAID